LTEIDWTRRLQEEGEDIDDTPELETPEINRPANLTQHTLLSYISSNYDVWVIIEPIIKPEYFDEEYKPVVKLLLDHSQQYKQIPNQSIIRMKTGVMLDTPGDAQDSRTAQWLLDEIQTFCRHRATGIEIKRASLAILNDSSREALELIFQNFKTITEISLEKDLGIEVHHDARRLLNETDNEIIKPTNYKHLDRIVGNGFPCPGLVMFAGISGLGKSVTLENFGVNYCEQGEFVVYITLELGEKRIFQRACSMMADHPIRSIYSDRDKISGHMEYRLGIGDGLFQVKKMKMSGTTVAHIHAYLKELYIKTGRKPTVLILDYLDLLHPRTHLRDLGNIHIKDKYAAEELYSLCEDWNLLGITASQMVKNSADMDAFDHAAVAGGTPKINTMDYVIALQRKDEELIMRILKGRYGGEGVQIPFFWNINTLRISDGTDEEFFKRNPRYDPHYKRDTAEKTSISLRTELNKDVRRVKNDQILDRIKKISPELES
jgi:hypothetical protein